jgi:hypothetical protein
MILIRHKFIFGLIVLILAAAAVLLDRLGKSYEFYYPDKDLKVLKSEQRTVEVHGRDHFEESLIRDYLLGPERYDLKLPCDNNLLVKNVWLVTNWKIKSIVINFNEDFSLFAGSNKDSAAWLLKGLMETVKAGTRADKIIIYVEDHPCREKIGNWNLAYAIPLHAKK